jgi:hypothetical protein
MPGTGSSNNMQSKVDVDIKLDLEKSVRYKVVLDGVRTEVETHASFALKFSLLASLPVTKIKHMTKNLPATVWKGQGKSRAFNLLNLIEEAGGTGRVVEEEYSPDMERVAGGDGAKGRACPQCGFPLKEEDLFCSFCLTPVDEAKRESLHIAFPRGRNAAAVYRCLFIILLGAIAIILALALRV